MRSVEGVIILAQESRFKLVDDAGITKLFVLAHDAPIEPQDLQPLARTQARVAIRYEDTPALIAGIVHGIEYAGRPRSPDYAPSPHISAHTARTRR
ncbi:hypothetical protein [Azospirillum sp. SYSU D00513]|uniref:hypothetical protein n=1 Tax=Azospirillum sp. SYSU D00513 TaxID=2812561 RepID=UPI001A9610E2|nr:hypothetical protein [Azospirillum sp. SYSU D00513]